MCRTFPLVRLTFHSIVKTILVIGAGFSGIATTTQILKQNPSHPLRVVLAHGGDRFARGLAYGTQNPEHMLNVPAGNMSAVHGDDEHFLRFARVRNSRISKDGFVSRQLYGDYLEWMLRQAEQETIHHSKLELVFRSVTSVRLHRGGAGLIAQLDDHRTIVADKVVLALGHFPSSPPQGESNVVLNSKRYVRDPWDAASIARIPSNEPVLLLGTGLTMVDVATTLLTVNPRRQIAAISRRGLVPHSHRDHNRLPDWDSGARAIWGQAVTVREQLRAFREHIRRLGAQGQDWRDGMASLRSITADVWLEYTETERKRFLRHVQPYWDIHRHRLAPESHQKLSDALDSGMLKIMAARIIGLEENRLGIQATVRPRGQSITKTVDACAIINCTGPCANPLDTGNALVEQLLRDGLIRTDRLGIGLDVADDYATINQQGISSRSLFYIGPWLKAKYWEATAVPDLRRFALALAQRVSRVD